MVKNFFAFVLLTAFCHAQLPTSGSSYQRIGADSAESWSRLKSTGTTDAGPYVVLPPAKPEVQLEPYRTHYDFSAVESKPNHNRRTFWLSFAATTAVLTTIVLLKLRDPQCRHYEGNQSGVNVPCPSPKEESK